MPVNDENLLIQELEALKVNLFIARSKLRKATNSGNAETIELSNSVGGSAETLTEKISDVKELLGPDGSTDTVKTRIDNAIAKITSVANMTLHDSISDVSDLIDSNSNSDNDILSKVQRCHTKIGGDSNFNLSEKIDSVQNSVTHQLTDVNTLDFELVSYTGSEDYTFTSPIFDADSLIVGSYRFQLISHNIDPNDSNSDAFENQIVSGSQIIFQDSQNPINKIYLKYKGINPINGLADLKIAVAAFLFSNLKAAKIYKYPLSDRIDSIRTMLDSTSISSQKTLHDISTNIKNKITDEVEMSSDIEYFTVADAFSFYGSIVSVSLNLNGSSTSTFTYSFGAPINNGSSIKFEDLDKFVTFISTSSTAINNTATLVLHLDSRYPFGSVYSRDVKGNLDGLNTSLDEINGSNIRSKLGTIRSIVTTTPGSSLTTDLNTVKSKLTLSDESIEQKITEIMYNVGSHTSTTLAGKITDVQKLISGSTASSIFSSVTSLKTEIDDTVVSLPGNQTKFTVTSINDGTPIQMSLTFPDDTSYSGVYNIIKSDVGSNYEFSAVGTKGNVVFINTSATGISSTDLFSYISSLYPLNKTYSINISDNINSAKLMVGGNLNTLVSRIAQIDRQILITPTGKISDDLVTLRSKISSSLGNSIDVDVQNVRNLVTTSHSSSLDVDIQNVRNLIGGSNQSLNLLIGNPSVSRSTSTLFNMVGGYSESTNNLGLMIGDIKGNNKTGLAGLIMGDNTEFSNLNVNPHIITALNDATNLFDLLSAFNLFLETNPKINNSPTCIADAVNDATY